MPNNQRKITNEVIYEKLLKHDKKFGTINKKLKNHDVLLNQNEIKLTYVFNKLEKHDKRFDRIDAVLMEFKQNFSEITAYFNSLNLKLEQLSSNFNA